MPKTKSKSRTRRTKPRKIRKTCPKREGQKLLLLDVHSDHCALVACDEFGEVLLQMQVPTTREDLRKVVEGIPGPKRVVFENGPMSALVNDALKDSVDEMVSSDPTRNALIARSEDSCDEMDAW